MAKTILETGEGECARVLALVGNLGAGKTNFVQGFAKGLGVKETINSPTFVILRKYPLAKSCGSFKTFYHIDCYRLGSVAELSQLRIENILKDPANIIAIEWPEIVKQILPKGFLAIDFKSLGGNGRRISVIEAG